MFRGLSSASFLVVAGIVALLSGCSSPNEPPPKTYTLTILSTPGGATIPSGAVAVEPGVATHIQPNASGGYTCPLCLTLFDGTATISGFSVTLNDGDATVRVDWKPGPLPLPQPPFSPPALAPSGSFQILHDGTDVTNADFDFGSHVTFSSTTETFSVKNKTTSTVTLSAGNPYITDRRDFAPTAASGAPLSIAPDGTAEFHVQFIPTTTGQESADLYVDFTTIGAVSFPVRGTGASSGTDYLVQYQKNGTTWTTVKENDAIAFPALSSGSASVLFRIVNTGSGPLGMPTTGAFLNPMPNTAGEFATQLPPVGTLIAEGDNAEFKILVMYKGAGSYLETIILQTSSATHPSFAFRVSDTQN